MRKRDDETVPWRTDLPRKGWFESNVVDLGVAEETCEFCGYCGIRYQHHIEHDSADPLKVGVVCAGRMTGDIELAEKLEHATKVFKRPFKKTRTGNFQHRMENMLVWFDNKSQQWAIKCGEEWWQDRFETSEQARQYALQVIVLSKHKSAEESAT